ncbi:hypothetical protein BH11ARM1_BH11ARM1_08060 [soil metagenome]
MFEMSEVSITPPIIDCSQAGGFVTFEGRVRSSNEGHAVQFLEYQAFDELAISEGKALVEEARRRFGLDYAHAIHRVGKLGVGDMAVWISCGAAHRKEAFLGTEFLIDEMKHRLPIWKKEHYVDGPSEWINQKQETVQRALSRGDIFSRQLVMPEVGATGQAAIGKAKVLVVGAGGLANGALPYLAAAGVGTIGIVEPDTLEPSNLHRQVLYGYEDVGRSKARLAAESLRKMHPFVNVLVFEEFLHRGNARAIVDQFDIVVDGTDRFDAKFLMNDICIDLGKPLVQASIYRLEGYLQTILPGGPCLRCLWPEAPVDGCVSTCEQSGVLGVVPGIFGLLEAAEALKIILGFGEILSHHQLVLDMRDFSMQRIQRNIRSDCSCHGHSDWKRPADVDWEVSAADVLNWHDSFICIDIREADELRQILDLGQTDWRQIPKSQFNISSIMTEEKRILILCAAGHRSGELAFRLRDLNYQNVYSLKGGANQALNIIPS